MPDKIVNFTLTPRTRENIRKDVFAIRESLGLRNILYFNIMEYLELVLQKADPEFYVCPVPNSELPKGQLAITIPSEHMIKVKLSVYNAACDGHPWARYIMAHEFGHYVYHSASDVVYAKVESGTRIPAKYNAEYQADMFAAELLAPLNLIKKMTAREIANKCGIPQKTATNQSKHARMVVKKHRRKKRKNGQTAI